MLAKLYNERSEYHTEAILAACKLGVDFLRKFARRSDGRVYFSLSQAGKVSCTRSPSYDCVIIGHEVDKGNNSDGP